MRLSRLLAAILGVAIAFNSRAASCIDAATRLPVNMSNFRSIAVGELDGVPGADIVGGLIGTELSVTYGRGDGTFDPAAALPTSFEGLVHAADLNGDGLAEILEYSGSIDVTIFRNDGARAFTPLPPLPWPGLNSPYDFVVADFGAGSAPDIAVLGLETISVYFNDGMLGFSPPVSFPVANATSLAAGDLDGDGIADLVAGSRIDEEMSVVLSHGDGTFAAETRVPYGAAVTSGVVIADLDGDTMGDVAAPTYGASCIRVFPGIGGGSLGLPWDLPTAVPPQELASADVDGDGLIDFVYRDFFDGVTVRRNLSGRAFGAAESWWAGGDIRLAFGDVDHANGIDLVTGIAGNATAAEIRVH